MKDSSSSNSGKYESMLWPIKEFKKILSRDEKFARTHEAIEKHSKEAKNDGYDKVKENILDVETQGHFIGECSKPQRTTSKSIIGGAWSENREIDYLTKFDPKSYEGVFLGYSQNSKAYIILNKQTMKVEESLNVTFDETPSPPKTLPLEDDELVKEEAIEIMHDEFEMSLMRELNVFLGLQIKELDDGIFFNQSKYILEMLKKFGLEDSKQIKTPISTETKLTRDEEGESVDNTKYRGMIEDPKTSHLEAVKRIFRYIKGTMHLGLWYPKGSGIETIVYADSDHARDYVDRKSTSGVCMFMGCCLTSLFSKK
ncbi:retrovirus-related pol polyprotein from transposon TNT 1-94 [Tanacetum coccineum]